MDLRSAVLQPCERPQGAARAVAQPLALTPALASVVITAPVDLVSAALAPRVPLGGSR